MLKEKAGLANDQIDKILKLNSRWVAIHKCYPLYVVSEHSLYLL